MDNEEVEKGDTLLIVEAGHLENRRSKVNGRLSEIKSYIDDLTLLSETLGPSAFNKAHNFNTALYAQQYNEFKQRVFELNTSYIKEKRDLKRSKQLYQAEAGHISNGI